MNPGLDQRRSDANRPVAAASAKLREGGLRGEEGSAAPTKRRKDNPLETGNWGAGELFGERRRGEAEIVMLQKHERQGKVTARFGSAADRKGCLDERDQTGVAETSGRGGAR